MRHQCKNCGGFLDLNPLVICHVCHGFLKEGETTCQGCGEIKRIEVIFDTTSSCPACLKKEREKYER